ncbi:hypothetical protein GOP47_0017102 [Adiantum capillus-veneris]|uniref:P-type ATPase A domain-containing protein n=1 Tax=Adiantum capillus-veneris TaxID=13818 RepID=A0A9D4ZBT8_ADICA|nr:hypothetical protein GOP47_0016527 [Adiantum capillus-veneris]KAI5068757.1 hypothetical protein GOP47_0017102 [Adiantum capillus-veneris]
MGKYPVGPTACSENSSCHVLIQSLTNWAPILVFSFWGYAMIVIIIFLLYRKFQTLKRSLTPVIHKEGPFMSGSVHFENSAEELGAKEDVRLDVNNRDLHITGYENTAFGEFCYILCCVVSLHWLALFILIFFDAYNQCEVGGIDNLCFYGNHVIFGSYEFNAKIFFVIWWLAAIWFIGWVINRGRVRNWFRLPCTLSQAHVVNVWAQDQREVLSVNVSFVIQMVRIIQNKLIPLENRGHFETHLVTRTAQGQHFFVFRGERYLIKGNSILKASIRAGNSFSDFHQGEGGLTQEEAERRFNIIGKNEIPFQPETLMQTTCEELFSLFHVYQLVMYLSWFWNSYLFVAALMAVVVCLSAAITIYTKHRSQLAIAKLTRYVTQVNVFRNQTWCSVDSRDIVPGDVVKVADDWLLPCDLVIIRGSCICDESALTGEAAPVQKYHAPNNAGIYQAEGHGTRHTLFSGTRVLQAGSRQNHNVLAVVTATGMATSKGKLLAAILYPEQMLFKYDEELPVVVILLLIYALVCFIISLLFMNMTGAETIWVTKWTYCIAIVNQIMSPLLPVALEVGQLQAVERLKTCGIFSLNPSRIAIAGKIRVFCFDKTGTLTKEGLDFIGVQGLQRHGNEILFGSVKAFDKGDEIDNLTRHGLATCHAVSKYGSRYVGNEVEVKMFQAVGWELIENFNEPDVVYDGNSEKLKVIKRYEFDHTRATMSVVVQDIQGSFAVYCKGSFEKLQQLCFQESLPEDYLRVAQKHALDGCYVLSLGYKSLGDGLALEEILEMPRDVLEMELQFVSLILFRNEPKADSQVAIKSVKEGEVRPVMVTGDNAQCGYYIAKQCGMVAPCAQIFLGEADADSSIFWVPMSAQMDDIMESVQTAALFDRHQKGLESGVVELAVTGKVFNILRRSGWMEKLLFSVRIFARFSPEDKVLITNMYRDQGVIVGMCGDGGNDCGALRVAHAGIALSEAEASVVSPFTSKEKSILSVVDLLREGRGALHTSFACYKFLIMYGLMFSIFKLCCYWYGVIVCQMGYLFIDGVAVLTLGYAMTLSHPEDILGKARPTSSLLGSLNVSSVFGVWFINIMFLIGAIHFMASQPDYVKWPARYSHGANWWTLGDNWESTVLFFTMYFQFITSAFIFTFGSSFRKSVFHNWTIVVFYGSLMVLMSVLLLLPPSGFTSLWHVASEQFNSVNSSSPVWTLYQEAGGSSSPAMSFDFRLRLWLLIMGSLATIILWQKVFAEGVIAKFVASRFPSVRQKFLV